MNIRDYRNEIEKRDECEIDSPEWTQHQEKIRQIVWDLMAAGNEEIVDEIIDELNSLNDCGCEITDEAVAFDLKLLEENGLDETAESIRQRYFK